VDNLELKQVFQFEQKNNNICYSFREKYNKNNELLFYYPINILNSLLKCVFIREKSISKKN